MMAEGYKWQILVVDDRQADEIAELFDKNKDKYAPDEINIRKIEDFDEAIESIASSHFDLVILDIKDDSIDMDDGSELRGLEVYTKIKEIRFVPVIFYTALPEYAAQEENAFVSVIERGDTEKLLDSTKYYFVGGFTRLNRHLEIEQRKYMWEFVSENWKELTNDIFKDQENQYIQSELTYMLTRRLAYLLRTASVRNYIDSDDTSDSLNIHPIEMYLYPPQNDTLFPGDIVLEKENGEKYLVLTPACDIAQEKADHVLLVHIFEIINHSAIAEWKESDERVEEYKKQEKTIEKTQKELETAANKKKGEVKSLLNNRSSERYRILPGTFFLSTSVIDFQSLKVIPIAEKDNYDIICSLDSPFREQMSQYFSTYYGRIGTPDMNRKDFINKNIEELQKKIASE
jgi:CheY-like chemotaxis protein